LSTEETVKKIEEKYGPFHQESNHCQCPKCKQYKWYTNGKGTCLCKGCGYSYTSED